MDLNQLYFEHQSQMMKAGSASLAEVRELHERNADILADRIGQMQHVMGAAAAASWTAIALRNASNDAVVLPFLPAGPGE
jgi:hypothetical protein